ncbi:hypothetical protein PPERSA_02388 [Pseudocohnilembus persalinus]|uniref:Transmembrane protein n=1 Tax=Pseudocohnilembus persalinus TaxID=266149 RepID=A0A0V0QBJ5_PSEPJ|nr:hypothetical protein PPERSA_02388 [Pseudocohnilembus persalinus]|eukprot:KRW99530.1 hypothetical protein PPERSA_02388 [Pseudocohnilembus persalinus]
MKDQAIPTHNQDIPALQNPSQDIKNLPILQNDIEIAKMDSQNSGNFSQKQHNNYVYNQFNSYKSQNSISNANSVSQSQQSQQSHSQNSNHGNQDEFSAQAASQQENQKTEDDESEKNFPKKVIYLSVFLLLVGIATLIIGIFQPYFFILTAICLIPALYYVYKYIRYHLSQNQEQKQKVLDGIPGKK